MHENVHLHLKTTICPEKSSSCHPLVTARNSSVRGSDDNKNSPRTEGQKNEQEDVDEQRKVRGRQRRRRRRRCRSASRRRPKSPAHCLCSCFYKLLRVSFIHCHDMPHARGYLVSQKRRRHFTDDLHLARQRRARRQDALTRTLHRSRTFGTAAKFAHA